MMLTLLVLYGICMTFIDAESNRSRISCIMVVTKSDWMRIQNLPNRIGCGVKKNRVRTPLVSGHWQISWHCFWTQKDKFSLETLHDNLQFFVLLFHAYRFAVSSYSSARPKVSGSSLMEWALFFLCIKYVYIAFQKCIWVF